MITDLVSVELTERHFKAISALIYRLCGINLPDGKEGLVKSRLLRRLRVLGLDSFDRYLRLLQEDKTGQELATMVDLLTTNKTSFFRESQHFDYLRSSVLPIFGARNGRRRIWSAGCSTGEEPYSLAVLLREELPNIDQLDINILATDINREVLERARAAVYEEGLLLDLPARLRQNYFRLAQPDPPRAYRIVEEVQSLVRFARLNLMGDWPMKGPFDVIFCRNVMIYFDKPTQQGLVQRFWELLSPGGHLFVGHSETLTTSGSQFRYVQPAVYIKCAEWGE